MAKERVEGAEGTTLINCLTKERVIVRYIPKQTGKITNPKHLLYGGMARDAVRGFVVPKLTSGRYVNVLTDDEKDFLEDVMGLEKNALSVYKRDNNFWSDANPLGIGRVMLNKQDNYFDLSNPQDYIRYKVLLANKDYIAPSLQALEDSPKATYQFVCIREGEEVRTAKNAMDIKMQCYREFGKIDEDADTLRVIIETLDGRPVSQSSKIEFLQTKIDELIQANAKTFYKVITDKLLPTKVLIKNAVKAGIIYKKGDFHYLRNGNTPLCEEGEDPTLSIAAKYLNAPKHQSVKFAIETELKQDKKDD